MTLIRQPLGRTGFEVSPITFGTSALASLPDTYGYQVSEDQARATLLAIFDSDINVLDTSRNYGFGRAEERIGAV
ncbi:MAG: aldo/keto reductase, partial [Acidimicrobiia bacterium]|nr:aldo/keto reductase [Acidimicrobiia bacterium]